MSNRRTVARVDERDPILVCTDCSSWLLAPIDWPEVQSWAPGDEVEFTATEGGLYDWRVKHDTRGYVAEATRLADDERAARPAAASLPWRGAAVMDGIRALARRSFGRSKRSTRV